MSLPRSLAFNYLGRIVSLGSVYLFIPFYVRLLGIEQYGVIAFYAVVLTLGSLADIGLSTTFAREAARERSKTQLLNLLTTIERLLVATSAAFALVIFFGAEFIATRWLNSSPELSTETIASSIRLMGLMLPFQLAISLYIGGLLGLHSHGRANVALSGYALARSGLVILPLMAAPSLSTFFGWQLIVSVAFMVATRSMLLQRMEYGAFSVGVFSVRTIYPLLAFAGTMLGISLIASVNTQLDKLVVSKVFTVEQFGYYSLGATLAQLPSVVTGPMMAVLFPRLTALTEARRHRDVAAVYESFSFVVALLASTAAFGIILFAAELLEIWVGRRDFPNYVTMVTQLLACGGLLLSLATVPFYLGLSNGHNRTSLVLGLVTLLVTVPLLLIATRTYGLIGAALPWIVLNAASFIVLAIVINRFFYPGEGWAWLVRYTAFPSILGAAVALVAKAAADLAAAAPLIRCGVAAATASVLLMAIAFATRKRLHFTQVAWVD